VFINRTTVGVVARNVSALPWWLGVRRLGVDAVKGNPIVDINQLLDRQRNMWVGQG
jgi:hypothetical protein